MNKFLIKTMAIVICGASPFAYGAGNAVSMLESVARDGALSGGFVQVMFGKDGKPLEEKATGVFAFRKPAAFRWETLKPYQQVIVSDGRSLSIYDPDLMQMTVKPLTGAVSSTPAALLFSGASVRELFTVTEETAEDGRRILEARPRKEDPAFSRVEVTFSASGELKAMSFLDHFGQKTLIEFRDVRSGKSAQADPARFSFVPPQGTDILREGTP